jgi:uncharacterized protein (DUF1501 family)
MMERRTVLAGTGLLASLSLFPVARRAWAVAGGDASRKRLIVVFLRGAADSFNILVPYTESAYYDVRPKIAVPRPGQEKGAIDLDGRFGLHPALRPLEALWRDKTLAFVTACGSPDATRSHFDAQAFMETGTPGVKTTPDGWLNRLLAVLPKGNPPPRAVSFESLLPLILRGDQPVATIPIGPEGMHQTALDRPEIGRAFESLYSGSGELAVTYREGKVVREEMRGDADLDMDKEMRMADNGAPPPTRVAGTAARLARLIDKEPSLRLGFMSFGGWDTHAAQGGAQGKLANNLAQLGSGLASLATALGENYKDTVILVVSEFGRTFRENGNGGTDHGHGTVLWVLGGGVRGGRIYGDWPGLGPSQLHENRDMAVTTDFRAVLAVLIERHMRLGDAALTRILPNRPLGHNAGLEALVA